MTAYEYCELGSWEHKLQATFRGPQGVERKIYEVTSADKDEFESWKRSLPRGWHVYDIDKLVFLRDKVVTKLLSEGWQMHPSGMAVFFRQFHQLND